MASDEQSFDDQRETGRQRIEFEVIYNAGREEGSGVLSDISSTGALIGEATLRPRIGSDVHLHLILYGDEGPVRMHGRVTRHTDTGFAIEITRWFRPAGLEDD